MLDFRLPDVMEITKASFERVKEEQKLTTPKSSNQGKSRAKKDSPNKQQDSRTGTTMDSETA